MFQTVLMLLVPPQNAGRTEFRAHRPASRMATRARSALAPGYAGIRAKGQIDEWNEVRKGERIEVPYTGRDEASIESREDDQVSLLEVVGNALGFALLMTALWLLTRLAESLLS